VHERVHDVDYVWSVSCVYDAALHEAAARALVEKVVMLMESQRATSTWRAGSKLAAQQSFAPVLLANMEQVNANPPTEEIQEQVEEIKGIMASNIELILQRADKLEDLQQKANALSNISLAFQRKARDAKRFQLWQQAKFGMVAGTAAAVAIGVLIVPAIL